MDAMILAAGFGTRLRPLTLTTPKALVPVGGVPMLERVARRLVAAGADRLLVNVSYLGEQVEAFVRAAAWTTPDGRPVEAAVSAEPGEPRETGGGLKRAAAWFRPGAPFLLHNADALTTTDLAALWAAQRDAPGGRLATLAVAPAHTGRALLFDGAGLSGYTVGGGEPTRVRDAQGAERLADFCGVQACAPELLGIVLATAEARFSIMDTYLQQARRGAHVGAFEQAPPVRFLDVGTPERLGEANAAVAAGRFA